MSPVSMRQDHGQRPEVCRGAIELGFSSVTMDGSLEADGKSIASNECNVDVTRTVVAMAHALVVTVEGKLGCLGLLETMRGDKEDGHGTDATMTRVEAEGIVSRTCRGTRSVMAAAHPHRCCAVHAVAPGGHGVHLPRATLLAWA